MNLIRRRCAEFIKKEHSEKQEHVKAHRSKKEKQHMLLFDQFVTEGIGRTDVLAKDGAMEDEGESCTERQTKCGQTSTDM